jgi:hypothetical protein
MMLTNQLNPGKEFVVAVFVGIVQKTHLHRVNNNILNAIRQNQCVLKS